MRDRARWWLMVALLLGACITLAFWGRDSSQAQEPPPGVLITGRVKDTQNVPVVEAEVRLLTASDEVVAEALTQADGRYALAAPEHVPDSLTIRIDRPHFEVAVVELGATDVRTLKLGEPLVVPDTVLPRAITPAFWIAAVIFAAMLLIVATGRVHTTLAALAGASLVFAISYLGPVSYTHLTLPTKRIV